MAPEDLSEDLTNTYDRILSPYFVGNMVSVGMWYKEFVQVEDDEVLFSLNRIPDKEMRLQDET